MYYLKFIEVIYYLFFLERINMKLLLLYLYGFLKFMRYVKCFKYVIVIVNYLVLRLFLLMVLFCFL